jgi:hypothetical protein
MTKHPLFEAREVDFTQMLDCYDGERKVKEKRTTYLPATSGMIADGMTNASQNGSKQYEAYVTRAVYPDFVRQAVDTMVGMMVRRPAKITVPAKMEPLLERLGSKGENAQTMLRKIYEEQIKTGRLGLFVDAPMNAPSTAMPYVSMYGAMAMKNWATSDVTDGPEEPTCVMLDESGYIQDPITFEWKQQVKWRIARIFNGTAKVAVVVGSFRMPEADDPAWVEISIGGRKLDKLPFEFVNSVDLCPEPNDPPLLGLSHLALAVYRLEADYRQTLFMQGQETLVVVGGRTEGEERRVGASAKIELPMGGKAEYIGVNANGLSEMRTALENDKSSASEMGARLLDFRDSARQSGDALRVRVASKVASLPSIAITGAQALENVLKRCAILMGVSPDEVKVEPNTDFIDEALEGQNLLNYMQARRLGAPLSLKSVHRLMKRRDLTGLEFEKEIEEIEAEQENMRFLLGPSPEELHDDQIDLAEKGLEAKAKSGATGNDPAANKGAQRNQRTGGEKPPKPRGN